MLHGKLKRSTSKSTFTDPLRIPFVKPLIQDTVKTGYLYKQGQLNSSFKKRYFILSHKHLYYYKSSQDTKFTGVIPLLFSSFRRMTPDEQPGNRTHPHSFKIITPERIFYLHGDTQDDIDSWIDSLTKVCAKLWEEENKIAKDPKLEKSQILKQGWLLKQGNTLLKDWKHRWFVLKKDYIAYYKSEEDLTPLGTIPLLQCSVKLSTSVSKKYCFEFITPSRTFYAVANDPSDLTSWMQAIQEAITKTLERFFEGNKKEEEAKKEEVAQVENEDEDLKTIHRLLKELTAEADNLKGEDEDVVNKCQDPAEKLIGTGILEKIMQIPENKVCAECNEPDPKWASINIGIFVCIECSGIHRSLGVHLSKIRSIDLDVWDLDTLEFMETMGNKKARAIWEFNVPNGYERPNPKSPRNTKSAWIQLKYVTRKFADPDVVKSKQQSQQPQQQMGMPMKGIQIKEGFLTKQGPKQEVIKSWRKRWFILKGTYLYYYITREDEIPAGAIPLAGGKVRIAANPGRNHCFEIVTEDRDFVISAEDSVEMFSWMSAIKDAIAFLDKKGLTSEINMENYIIPNPVVENAIKRKSMTLNEKFVKKRGYLLKKGNGVIKDWKQRYFVLYRTFLYYYETNQDYLPLGIIELPQCTIDKTKATPKRHYFDLVTPMRRYFFCAQSQGDMEAWISEIQAEINSSRAYNGSEPPSISPSPNNSMNLAMLNKPPRPNRGTLQTGTLRTSTSMGTIPGPSRPKSDTTAPIPYVGTGKEPRPPTMYLPMNAREQRSGSKPLPPVPQEPRERAGSKPLPPTPRANTIRPGRP